MLKEQLQQQTQQTKQALAQLILVREQLLTETNARIEAQVRILENSLERRKLQSFPFVGTYSATSAAEQRTVGTYCFTQWVERLGSTWTLIRKHWHGTAGKYHQKSFSLFV